jgi:Fe-S cluster assembly protein SufD
MTTKPKISIGVTKRDKASEKEFNFSQENIRIIPGSEIITRYRKEAYDAFTRIPMPDTKQEAWRRTDLRALRPGQFKILSENGKQREITEGSQGSNAGEFAGHIFLSPTTSRTYLDPALEEKGVIFTDLITAEEKHTSLLEQVLGSVIKADEGKFAALAAAFAQNGVFLYVPENTIVETPLQSVFSSTEPDSAFITQIVIFVDKGASVTFFHEYASDETAGRKFHAGLVETVVSENASLKFVEVQAWDDDVWNFTHERVQVKESGQLDWVIGALGSRLTKSFLDLDLKGSGAVGKVSGFSFTNHRQHLDYDTQQNHLVPNTTSDLLYKVALSDKSRSVWQGMIYVAPGADKTDGYQSNRNLVLSPDARADSIPGLEILADDVRCTHGATIGELNYDQIFYMMSRGIPRKEAEKLLVEGFFDPIMQRIPFENVRDRFKNSITNKLNLT